MRYLGERLVEPEATEFGYKALEFDESMAGGSCRTCGICRRYRLTSVGMLEKAAKSGHTENLYLKQAFLLMIL